MTVNGMGNSALIPEQREIMVMATNHFGNLAQTVQGVPQAQRPQKLIETISQQLQTSGDKQTQQFGEELFEVMPQILRAWQQ